MPPYLMEAPLNIVLLSLWLVVMLLDVPIHGVPGLEELATKLAVELLPQVKSITMVLQKYT